MTSEPLGQRAVEPVPEPDKRDGTDYFVLEQDGDHWARIGQAIAKDAADAIRATCNDEPGTYLAIPSRSWKPITVRVETVTRIKLEN